MKAGRIVSISDVRVILYLYTPYLESIEPDLLNLYGIVFYAICRGGEGDNNGCGREIMSDAV